jgi:hypothetical protein
MAAFDGLMPEEIEQAMDLGEKHKDEFYAAVKSVLNDATCSGISHHVASATITMEGLAIAAFMHSGTADSFVAMARRAIDVARDIVVKDQQGGDAVQ